MSALTSTRAPRGSGPAADGAARPQLTSLVDMMVILVVFLLHSFSADGQLIEPAADIDLPVSSVRTPVPPAVQVTISAAEIRVGGRMVASPDDADLAERVAAALAATDLRSTDLEAADLEAADLEAANLEAADLEAANLAPTASAPCAVQVDRGVPYRVLATVLAGCTGAGRQDVRLVVREDS